MDDTPRRAAEAQAELLEILAESEAEIEAGLFVDVDDILRELDTVIEEIEAEQAARPWREASAFH